MTLSPSSVDAIRAEFPGLRSDFAHLENAGGSQLPRVVIEAMAQFTRDSYVQTGGMYPDSERATATAKRAHDLANLMFNGEGIGYVAMGQSTTALVYMLANCFAQTLCEGDEVIISVANHESNAGPWARLAERGIVVKWWGVDPATGLSSLDDLASILSPRTKIIAFPRTSNLVGDVVDVAAVADLAHAVRAKIVVDVVASASHEPLDVRAWNADFCVMSHYKIYGPHMASMFGTYAAWAELEGPNHFFISNTGGAQKFELGCLSYEGCAGICALPDYLRFLIGDADAPCDRSLFSRGFSRMAELEGPIKTRLLAYLASRTDCQIIGSTDATSPRHPTISFVHESKSSTELCAAICARGFGIKSGHMYAYRLCEALGISPDPGVVRISAVHYNSCEEIDKLVNVLDEVL